MKKIYLSLLIILSMVLGLILYSRKSNIKPPQLTEVVAENNEKNKETLISTFKDYRESIYKIKQMELVKKELRKKTVADFKAEDCIKDAYDLNAFVMRARLAPNAIEKKDCQKLGKVYRRLPKDSNTTKKVKPSYQKRLKKDLDYFTEELNKQNWSNDDLVKRSDEFRREEKQNRIILKKMSRTQIKTKTLPAKCLKTILMHEREFLLTCKKIL